MVIRFSRVLGEDLDTCFYELRRKAQGGELGSLARLVYGGAAQAGQKIEDLLYLSLDDILVRAGAYGRYSGFDGAVLSRTLKSTVTRLLGQFDRRIIGRVTAVGYGCHTEPCEKRATMASQILATTPDTLATIWHCKCKPTSRQAPTVKLSPRGKGMPIAWSIRS